MQEDQILLDRVSSDPKIMGGKPVIRGTRLTVEFILNLLSHGASQQEILEEFEGLKADDIRACLLFATKHLEDTTFLPLAVEA
jgi:uncharacterized protein (DUF433 family)